jgi:hypothetical protein
MFFCGWGRRKRQAVGSYGIGIFSQKNGLFHIIYVLLLWIKIMKLLCPHLVDIQIRQPIKQVWYPGKAIRKKIALGLTNLNLYLK